MGAQHQRLRALLFRGEITNILKRTSIGLGCVLKSVSTVCIDKNSRSLGQVFVLDSVLILENSSRFSREPPGLPLSDFWEPRRVWRVLRTPRALDLVRPACAVVLNEAYSHVGYGN